MGIFYLSERRAFSTYTSDGEPFGAFSGNKQPAAV